MAKYYVALVIVLVLIIVGGAVSVVLNSKSEDAASLQETSLDQAATEEALELPERPPAPTNTFTVQPKAESLEASNYPIVDTGQTSCYNDSEGIACPGSGAYAGQDAQYSTNPPQYQDNGDGTVTDLVTNLMWIKDAGEKQQYGAAIASAEDFSFAGHSDWRIPTIKELYSLMDFRGIDPSSMNATAADLTPFIDTAYFDFEYGDESSGSRVIDSQWVTSSIYEATVMDDEECFFGVNFADGRIKCYPTRAGGNQGYFLRMVRGNTEYGQNNFEDNGDGTVSDLASGLMWQQAENGDGVLWNDALTYCENLSLGGKSDWRLPDIKELQSIVDYTRSPETTDSPALDPTFAATEITNEAGEQDWAFYWSGTTHINQNSANAAAYVSFGRALGNMSEFGGWIDVHGAGSQRSDVKSGVPAGQEDGHGPQGDARRSENYVRCVRDGAERTTNTTIDTTSFSQTTSAPPQEPPEQPESRPPQGQTQTGGEPPEGGSPPQEAIAACSQKSDGNACSFNTPQGNINGTCRTTPDDTVACVP